MPMVLREDCYAECDVCHSKGPKHPAQFEAHKLAVKSGWNYCQTTGMMICPKCKGNEENRTAFLTERRSRRPRPRYQMKSITIKGIDEYGEKVDFSVRLVEGTITEDGHCRFVPPA